MVIAPLRLPRSVVGLASLACLCLAACAEPAPSETVPPQPETAMTTSTRAYGDTQNLARRFQTVEGGSEFAHTDGELITVRPRDTIPAILSPALAPVSEASKWMEADELVIGLEIDGDTRAYPIKVLGRHEIVNDVVAGTPVATTW